MAGREERWEVTVARAARRSVGLEEARSRSGGRGAGAEVVVVVVVAGMVGGGGCGELDWVGLEGLEDLLVLGS